MAIELATAYVSIVPSFEGGRQAIEREFSGIGATTGKNVTNEMADEVEKSSGKSGRLGKALGGIGKVLTGGFIAGIAGSAAADLLGGFLSEAADAEKVAAQTAAVIKSTGGAANVTADQVGTLADALSMKAGVDDEVIASGENVLLTFTNIANQVGDGNDVFNQATGLALDMSSAMGTDLQGSIVQVGKALNDPIQGISALSRVGVTFTDQQKEQIKTLVESGDTLGAQKVILSELSTEFGGAAAAGATSSDKLNVAWGNVQEQLGTMLMPTFERFATWLSETLPDAVAAFQEWWNDFGDDIIRVTTETFTFIVEMIKGAVDMITAIIEHSVATWNVAWAIISSIVDFTRFQVIDPIVFSIQTLVDVVRTIIDGGIKAWNTSWAVVAAIVDFTRTFLVNPVILIIQTLVDVVNRTIQTGVQTVQTTWSAIVGVFNFFRDYVYTPLVSIVGGLTGIVIGLFAGAVAGALSVWNGIKAIYSFFVDNVYNPLKTAVEAITNGTVAAFSTAVTLVQAVWNGLKEAVAAPIRVVVGFYNSGIAGPWNFVADYVGLPRLKTIELATGGQVPGTGNKDTVPAWLTPGEYVLTKDAAKAWGPELLKFLNDPDNAKGKTVDPGIFGYAGGGPVYRAGDDVLNFAKQQVGKPYSYSAGGSGNADCSYLWSVLVNYALGAGNPYTRRFSTGTIQGDRALAPGLSDLATGMNMGVRPPYQVNKAGQFVGHMAGTLMGVNFESTPPATRMSPAARGAVGFPVNYNLPGFGGPSVAEQAAADQIAGLRSAHVGATGGGMFGNIITALFNKLPGAVFDFLVKKLPEVIFNAVKDAVGGAIGGVAGAVGGVVSSGLDLIGLEQGGTVPRTGPILVGERRPEVLWANRGQYVQAEAAGGVGGSLLTVQGNLYGDSALRRMLREELAALEFERRAAVGAGRR